MILFIIFHRANFLLSIRFIICFVLFLLFSCNENDSHLQLLEYKLFILRKIIE